MEKKGILIYGASQEQIDTAFKEAAFRTGQLVAQTGLPLISGGGKAGLMRCAIDGVIASGGEAIGVLPAFMAKKGWQHPGLSRMMIEPDMHARKSTMASLALGVIAMPGGCGTLEELLEIITWRKLQLFTGRVVILNTLGFYDPLLAMLDNTIKYNFMFESHRKLWEVADTPEQALRLVLDSSPAPEFPQTIA